MREVAILVEGQTEEAFVTSILQPYVGYDVAYLRPIVVQTSRARGGATHRGGGRWKHYRPQLQRLLQGSHWQLVTTMIDFYGYPVDAPPCACSSVHRAPQCVRSRAAALTDDLGSPSRFLPFIALHEFEALVIASAAVVPAPLGDPALGRACAMALADAGGDAETINDHPSTAPSKRLAAMSATYDKVRDGIAIIGQSDFETALDACPGLRTWVHRIAAA